MVTASAHVYFFEAGVDTSSAKVIRFSSPWSFPVLFLFSSFAMAAARLPCRRPAWLLAAAAAATYIVAVSAVVGAGAAAASWTAAASLATPRRSHQAVRLLDGRVLVAGGNDGAVATTEIYDPAEDRWAASGDMLVARDGFALTLLADGTVLAAGGVFVGGSRAMRDCERFDPATGQWNRTGAMLTARANFAAARLLDGRVLAVGGGTLDGYTPTASAEVYDPATGTWAATGTLHTTFYANSAAVLRGGEVLVIGSDPSPYRVSEIYKPEAGEWSPTPGNLTEVRARGQTVTLLDDGRMLAVGGYGLTVPQAVDTSEVFDPATGRWTRTGSTLTETRGFHTAVLLLDGSVLVAGGDDGNSVPAREVTDTADLYDPRQDAWVPAPSMATPRTFHTATLLQDGRVLVTGGYTGRGPAAPTSACELYA